MKISFNKKTVALEEGQKIQLKINLKNYKKQNLKWSSTNKSIVTVSSKGKIFAKKAGKAKIIVKAGKKKAVCSIIVNKNKKREREREEQRRKQEEKEYDEWYNRTQSLSKNFYNEEPIMLSRGESYDLKKEVHDFSDEVMEKYKSRIFFKSTCEVAIEIDENGVITAKNPGKVAVAYKIVTYKDKARTIEKAIDVVKYFRIISCPDENPSYIVPEVDTEKCGTVDFWRSVVPKDYLKSLFHGEADDMIDKDVDWTIETILAPGNYYQHDYIQWSEIYNIDYDSFGERYYQGDMDQVDNLKFFVRSNMPLPSSDYTGLLSFEDHSIFGNLNYDKESQVEYIAMVKATIQEYRDLVSGCSTDHEKMQLIADKMADEWSYSYESAESAPVNQDLWSALVLKETVCVGYSVAEQMILNSVGIPALYVGAGNGEWVPGVGGHAVDYVFVDGCWYGSDITWYDTGNDKAMMLYTSEDVEKMDKVSKYDHTPTEEYELFIPQI